MPSLGSSHMNKKILAKILIIIFPILIFVLIALLFRQPKASDLEPINRHATKIEPTNTTLFLAGDIMLSRNVDAAIVKANDPTLPFHKVADIIKNADISFANLESPFNDRGDHSIEGSLIFNADPKSVEGLKFAGFDILSTANNHAFDQGETGILLTKALLNTNEILPIGTGTECHDGTVLEKNNIKFGFLAYSYSALNNGGKTADPLVCTQNEQAINDIANIKSKVDILIVSMHAGTEYKRHPNADQITFARRAIDAGADLVIGHHPHWIQTIEQYKDKWILYSLGNFVFDQMWSQDTREGLTAIATFENKQLKKIELKPVIIDDYCCPRWANNQETLAILKKINPVTNTAILFEKGKISDSWQVATSPIK